MRATVTVIGFQLTGIEQGVPLCVGGLNRAFYLAGSRPDFPAWVSGIVPMTQPQIATLRSQGHLLIGGEYELRLLDGER